MEKCEPLSWWDFTVSAKDGPEEARARYGGGLANPGAFPTRDVVPSAFAARLWVYKKK